MATGDDFDRPIAPMSGLEKFYHDNFVLGIILSVCCNIVGLILSVIAYLQSKNAKAKNNAMICMIIAIVMIAVGAAARFAGVLGNLGGR
ncbi:MAG: hypothetical protein ACJ8F7_02025 [Gemmataceae bacterium]